MHYFLGIEAIHTFPNQVLLTQTKYVTDLLKKVGIEGAKLMPTRIVSGQKLSAHGGIAFSNPTLYWQIVGGFADATITMPNIAFAVNKVSQYMPTSRRSLEGG